MDRRSAVKWDIVCWVALIVAIWAGPQWVTKAALSIMIIWNGLCITWLARNSSYKKYVEQNYN